MAFVESTMRRTQVQLRYKRYKAGREDINDDTLPGRPSTSTIDELTREAVKKMIFDNHRITIRERVLMMLPYRSAHAKQLLRIFRH